ncbi:hypothetical protein IGI04_033739 [Brassica rapa subsp. trilocularis]|uniref:NPH3 domain-containing protein n=1 Tax=Brassica rapa subsp. trilocularis TaxID=1813537 RepID=A0ABQ7L6R0_BRACM|nr:hypothetical protein IGI04_033739 [Brassica rapa subsp. trilocularis]
MENRGGNFVSSTVYKEEANYGCEDANYLDKRVFYNLKKSFQVLTSCERHKLYETFKILAGCMEAIAMNACREELLSGLSEELKGRDCLEWWIEQLSALGINNYTRNCQEKREIVEAINYIRHRDLPELERRIGQQLESVRLDDLLIPSVGREESVHRVDEEDEERGYDKDSTGHHHGSLLKVGRIMDAYLAEIAWDPYLTLQKFRAIIERLPDYART